jgi:hypothetical protein
MVKRQVVAARMMEQRSGEVGVGGASVIVSEMLRAGGVCGMLSMNFVTTFALPQRQRPMRAHVVRWFASTSSGFHLDVERLWQQSKQWV